MAKKSSGYDKFVSSYYSASGYNRHKTFFSLLFTLLLFIGLVVSYSAVQQQKISNTNAFSCGGQNEACCKKIQNGEIVKSCNSGLSCVSGFGDKCYALKIPPSLNVNSCNGKTLSFSVTNIHPVQADDKITDQYFVQVGISYFDDGDILFPKIYPNEPGNQARFKSLATTCENKHDYKDPDKQFICIQSETYSLAKKSVLFNNVNVSGTVLSQKSLTDKNSQRLRIIVRQDGPGHSDDTRWGGAGDDVPVYLRCVAATSTPAPTPYNGVGATCCTSQVCKANGVYKGCASNLTCQSGRCARVTPTAQPLVCSALNKTQCDNHPTKCVWKNGNCVKSCSQINVQSNCKARNDCEWKNGQCQKASTSGGGTGGGGTGGGGTGGGGGSGGSGGTGGQTSQVKVSLRAGVGKGSGTVTAKNGKINCRIKNGKIVAGSKCSIQIAKGSDITFTAKPDNNSKVGWLGCVAKGNVCTRKNINKDAIITANFKAAEASEGNAKVTLKLSFQGIVSKPQNTDSMDVKLTLVHGGRQERNVTFTADDKGVWTGSTSFKDVTKDDNYILLVKGPKHLQKRACVNKPTENEPGTYSCFKASISLAPGNNTLDFTGIKQLTGDLPEQDGIVDSYDISLVRNIVALSAEERVSDENLAAADLNLDGIVDSQDYSLVIAALSVKADEK